MAGHKKLFRKIQAIYLPPSLPHPSPVADKMETHHPDYRHWDYFFNAQRKRKDLGQAGVGAPKDVQGDDELVPVSAGGGGLHRLPQNDVAATVQLLLGVLDCQLEVLWHLQGWEHRSA